MDVVDNSNTKAQSTSKVDTDSRTPYQPETSSVIQPSTESNDQNEDEAAGDGFGGVPCIQDAIAVSPSPQLPLADPRCSGMSELPDAHQQRSRVSDILLQRAASSVISSQVDNAHEPTPELPTHTSPARIPSPSDDGTFEHSALFTHLAHGLAYTTGSALGSTPPSLETCLAAYLVPNRVKLTAGSRAWAKHSHRSAPGPGQDSEEGAADSDRATRALSASEGWWGTAKGPVAIVNAKALALFWKVMNGATWRNLHWLPHRVLVYEVRVMEGYGMRWSQDHSEADSEQAAEERPWIFRGFLEPMMENGHELKWRHSISPTPPL